MLSEFIPGLFMNLMRLCLKRWGALLICGFRINLLLDTSRLH